MAEIELVIKIPEDVYTRLFDNGIQDNEIATDDICEMARSLRLGTPLPKGHGRLVDISKIDEDRIESDNPIIYLTMNGQYTEAISLDYLNDLPTIIEADKAESEEKK